MPNSFQRLDFEGHLAETETQVRKDAIRVETSRRKSDRKSPKSFEPIRNQGGIGRHSLISNASPRAVLIDADNLMLRGGGKRGRFNPKAAGRSSRSVDAVETIAWAGYWHQKEIRALAAQGIRAISAHRKADDLIVKKACRLLKHGYSLVIVSGNSDIGEPILEAAAPLNAEVTFWSLPGKAARTLTISRWVGDFVELRRRNCWTWLDQKLAAAAEQASRAGEG